MHTIYRFETLPEELYASAGGKARSLAYLAANGYPVPHGLVILPAAFEEDRLKGDNWQAVRREARRLAAGGSALFAVRSSSAGEDSSAASYAGEFDSLLNVPLEELPEAVAAVRRSRHNRRAAAYAAARGLSDVNEMAVIVQAMVPARISGVLFTADPVSGARDRMVGNLVQGLGDRLVSGEANPITFELHEPGGRPVTEQPDGAAGFLREQAGTLFRLAKRLEKDMKAPQDIEWAFDGDTLQLLQARPITTYANRELKSGEWNDSHLGDYLWTSTNFGEALPDVMTPLTWSAMRVFFRVNRVGIETDTLPMGGNIGGRIYMNLSLAATFFSALGFSEEKMRRMAAETFGTIPDDIAIPRLQQPRWETLKAFLPNAFRRMRLIARLKKGIPAFIENTPARAAQLRAAIEAAGSTRQLVKIWHDALSAEVEHTMLMLAAGTSDYKRLSRQLRARLVALVGDGDANALLSGLHPDDPLESLGPLVGLTSVGRGELSRRSYLKQFGHRGPSEFELSIPTPGESTEAFEAQLNEVNRSAASTTDLLAAQHRQHQAARDRMEAAYPRQAPRIRRELERLAQASRTREAARSEVVRMHRVLRAYALRAGELARIGEDVFFLTLDEIAALLGGDPGNLDLIPGRRSVYESCRDLPPYPVIIRGRFDPEKWSQDPRRRTDVYDPYAKVEAPGSSQLKGFPGSPGVVEGLVRVLDSPAEGLHFQTGEILVANTTNVGWTPLFPRAAAIVTDIGAPLSHAAIVARELGIPAVVGTGTATMQLRSGDRVRVNGEQGTVDILAD